MLGKDLGGKTEKWPVEGEAVGGIEVRLGVGVVGSGGVELRQMGRRSDGGFDRVHGHDLR